VLLAALLSSATSLANGYALDDVLLIETDPLVHSLREPWTLLTSAYWRLPPADTLWRPLGTLGYALQWAVADGKPWPFHVVSVSLYLAVCAIAFGIARRLLPFGPALVAAFVFAVHPVHVESVGNIVGQLELSVSLAILGALLLYVRDRQNAVLRLRTIFAICALQLMGLGFKEHAVMLPFFLVAAELTVLRGAPVDGGPRTPGFSRVRILLVSLSAIVLVWMLVRSDVIGGDFAGDWPHRALRGLDTSERAWVMLGLVPEIVRLMFLPLELYADYSPQFVPVLSRPSEGHLLGAIALMLWAVPMVIAWRRDRLVAFALIWFPVSLLVVSNIFVPTGVLIAERTLFLATFGVALLAGGSAALMTPRLSLAHGQLRALALGLVAAVIFAAAARSSARQLVWRNNGTVISSIIRDAPTNFRGHLWLGDSLFRANNLHDGEAALQRARALWPAHDAAPLLLAVQYQNRGICRAAIPIYQEIIRLEPRKPAAHFGLAGCYFGEARFTLARRTALDATAKIDRAHRAFAILVMHADSALAAHDTVRANNRWLLGQARRSR